MRTVALIVAIALGIAAAIGVRSYLKSQQSRIEQEYKPVRVAAARGLVEAGKELTREMVTMQEVPARMLSRDMIAENELDRYLGREVTRDIGAGTQIRVGHFLSREPRRVAAQRLAEGQRAIAIAVDATSGIAGLVRPGDHLDILATTVRARRKGGGLSSEPETWKVLSDVTVLAVDDRMGEAAPGLADYRGYRRGYSSFTLAVTPLEAQLLAYLKDNSKLTFALRPRSELGEKQSVPAIDGSNVRQLAAEANRRRQEEIQELEEAPLLEGGVFGQ